MQQVMTDSRSKKHPDLGDTQTSSGEKPAYNNAGLLDFIAQKPSELDAINGMVPVLSKELGLPTPVNDDLVAKVRLKEASFKG